MINITRNKKLYHVRMMRQWQMIERPFTKKFNSLIETQLYSSADYIQHGIRNIDVAVNKQSLNLIKTFYNLYHKVSDIYFEETVNAIGNSKSSNVEYFKKDTVGIFQALIHRWIINESARKVTKVNETTKKTIRHAIDRGLEEGLDYGLIAKNIRDMTPLISRYRSIMIARTEVHNAFGKVVDETINAAGLEPQEKEWSATKDERTRINHLQADGEKVSYEDPFIIGGEELMYAGDPNGSAENVINCRCLTLYNTVSVTKNIYLPFSLYNLLSSRSM